VPRANYLNEETLKIDRGRILYTRFIFEVGTRSRVRDCSNVTGEIINALSLKLLRERSIAYLHRITPLVFLLFNYFARCVNLKRARNCVVITICARERERQRECAYPSYRNVFLIITRRSPARYYAISVNDIKYLMAPAIIECAHSVANNLRNYAT